MHAFIAIVVVLGLTGLAGADAKKAMQLNAQGMKKYAKQDYYGAAELFEKAIQEDASLAYAHYNLASMASLNGDFPVAVRELEWCAKSTDPVAAKLLAKAKTDKDLEKALMHPRVRELAGMPALDKLTLDQILLERTGVWSTGDISCGPPMLAITFKKGGTFTVKALWGCNDTIERKSAAGKWSVKDGALVLSTKKSNKVFEPETTGSIEDCDSDGKYGKCLVLEMDEYNRSYLKRGNNNP